MRFIYAFLTFIGWIAVAYGAPGATSRKGYASNSRIKSAVAQGPSSACINSFYTTANSGKSARSPKVSIETDLLSAGARYVVLGTCKIDINQATMYVIQQIFKANPGYVKSQCLQYCSAPPPSTASPSVSVSAACQKSIQSAATAVNNACGQEVQAAATSLLAQTYQKNPSFIAAQCLPYCQPASKSVCHSQPSIKHGGERTLISKPKSSSLARKWTPAPRKTAARHLGMYQPLETSPIADTLTHTGRSPPGLTRIATSSVNSM